MAPHSSTLAWKIPWTEEPGGLQSMGLGSWRVRQDWATSLSRTGEGNGNPLQCSCLENPRDGGAWWAAVYGVTQSWTRLKRLSSSNQWLGSFVQEGSLPETFRITELGHESWQKKSLYEKEKNNFAIANIKSLQVWWMTAYEILINPFFLRDVREGWVLFIYLRNFKTCIWISELQEETWNTWTA